MASSVTNAPLPQPNVPFLNHDGTVSRAWWYFLISLNARTGGGNTPVTPIATLQKQINSLFVEEAMNDETPPVANVGLSLADVMADDAPPASLAPSLLAAWVGDAEPVAPLNPILAALLVADVT
jgi:hypothetical protein